MGVAHIVDINSKRAALERRNLFASFQQSSFEDHPSKLKWKNEKAGKNEKDSDS